MEQTKGKVRLGAMDATVHQAVSGRYGVSEESLWGKVLTTTTVMKVKEKLERPPFSWYMMATVANYAFNLGLG